MVAIVVASGVGKSTLLHVLGGLDRWDRGRIRIGDADLTKMSDHDIVLFRNRNVGFVFQFHHLLPEFSALENAEMPLRIARVPLEQARPTTEALLGRVGLADRLTHRPAMLSGGEQQRVAIAAALANEPRLLLADELTGELDSSTADKVMDVLGELNARRQLTLIVVTHNKSVAARARRQVRIADGQLFESEAVHA